MFLLRTKTVPFRLKQIAFKRNDVKKERISQRQGNNRLFQGYIINI